jgi:hypothetical protein
MTTVAAPALVAEQHRWVPSAEGAATQRLRVGGHVAEQGTCGFWRCEGVGAGRGLRVFVEKALCALAFLCLIQ